MALQKSYTHPSGAVFPDAYHRVGGPNIIRQLNNEHADVLVSIYKDSTARDELKDPVRSFDFSISDTDSTAFTEYMSIDVLDQTNTNAIRQCYEYMKTQTNLGGIDYTDSTDV